MTGEREKPNQPERPRATSAKTSPPPQWCKTQLAQKAPKLKAAATLPGRSPGASSSHPRPGRSGSTNRRRSMIWAPLQEAILEIRARQ